MAIKKENRGRGASSLTECTLRKGRGASSAIFFFNCHNIATYKKYIILWPVLQHF